MAVTSIRSEVRSFIDLAAERGTPVDRELLWGLVSRDVPEDSFGQVLAAMTRARQIEKRKQPHDGREGRMPVLYVPGPERAPQGRATESFPKSMGNMQMLRLLEAREKARWWLKEVRVAA